MFDSSKHRIYTLILLQDSVLLHNPRNFAEWVQCALCMLLSLPSDGLFAKKSVLINSIARQPIMCMHFTAFYRFHDCSCSITYSVSRPHFSNQQHQHWDHRACRLRIIGRRVQLQRHEQHCNSMDVHERTEWTERRHIRTRHSRWQISWQVSRGRRWSAAHRQSNCQWFRVLRMPCSRVSRWKLPIWRRLQSPHSR